MYVQYIHVLISQGSLGKQSQQNDGGGGDDGCGVYVCIHVKRKRDRNRQSLLISPTLKY